MVNCKLCFSENIKPVKKIKSPVNDLIYTLYYCKSCCSGFFNLSEHPVDLQTVYDNYSDRAEFSETFIPSNKWKHEKQIIEKLIKFTPNLILDLGCRTGDFLMHFPSSIQREGVELNQYFSTIAKKRGIIVHNDFLERINFTKSFDVVSCYAILEHLENPIVFLNSLASIVNKNGLLVIMIPARQSLKQKFLSLIKIQWHMYSPPKHLNFYSSKFIDGFMKKRGFKLVKRYYSSGGMFVLQDNNKFVLKCEKILAFIIDHSFLKRFPIFDHMYSYYFNKGK